MTSNRNLTIVAILLPLILFSLISTNIFGLIHTGTPDAATFWVSRIEIWIVLLITYLFSRNIEKEKFLLWPEQKRKPLFYILSLIILLIMVFCIGLSIRFVSHQFGIVSHTDVLNRMTLIMCDNKSLLIFTCLTAGFTEELIFRGFMLPRINLLVKNPTVSIILSSLLFGLAHIRYFDLNQILVPIGIGLVFAIFYYRYRCLTVLIICHFLIDIFSLYSACK